MIRKILLFSAILFFAVPASAQLMHRSEVSVGYGFTPATNLIHSYSKILSSIFTESDSNLKGWGAVTVGYNFRILGKLSVGAQIAYSSNVQTFKKSGDVANNHYWTVMPNVKWNWLGLKIVNFYSRVSAGITYGTSKSGGVKNCATQFAFQVSPIGVEVGGRLSAFAELGIGNSGCAIVGTRYRF